MKSSRENPRSAAASSPLVIGHRGAAAYATENTAESFMRAIEFGVDLVELDVRETLDRDFAVVHDSHLGRISGTRLKIDQTPLNVLKSVPLQDGQTVLSLLQVIQMTPAGIGLLVELKSIRAIEKFVRLARAQADRAGEFLTASFDLTLLRRVQRQAAELPLAVVGRTPACLDRARHLGLRFTTACLDFQCLERSMVNRLKHEGLRLFAWTVDRQADIDRMISLGVEGIISNRPDLVKARIAR
ncbi:MAG: glycerophosphodiester phosphodiesterase [Acidobacteriota bacterium]